MNLMFSMALLIYIVPGPKTWPDVSVPIEVVSGGGRGRSKAD